MRLSRSYKICDVVSFKHKLLLWSQQFNHVAFYDSNQYSKIDNNPHLHHTYEIIAGIGSIDHLVPTKNNFPSLKRLIDNSQDWIFGYFSYDLKNEIENLVSHHNDGIQFQPMEFFVPQFVFLVSHDQIEIHYQSGDVDPDAVFYEISKIEINQVDKITQLQLIPRIIKEEYLNLINQLLSHIHRGDIYEINFCQEFFNDQASINPVEAYKRLTSYSPAPFSCFYKSHDKYLLCASPERFLKKEKSKLYTQPIKGTIRRGSTMEEDIVLKNHLKTDTKELAENTMIVDLVRNDLSRTARRGSVRVEEYAGIYSFKLLHQMISTVSADIDPEFHIVDVIKNMFPMGSMTGAPKVRAMELIEKYEKTKRGLFSGAVGYFAPDNDFDFNVVIRSILYNSNNHYISCSFGGAITSKAVAEYEYEECLLKAKAIFKLFNHHQ